MSSAAVKNLSAASLIAVREEYNAKLQETKKEFEKQVQDMQVVTANACDRIREQTRLEVQI